MSSKKNALRNSIAALNVDTHASAIVGHLNDAEAIKAERVAGDFGGRINSATLTAYAHTCVTIAAAISAGVWSAGKGGASAMLKSALESALTASKHKASKAKRLVECAAAIMTGKAGIRIEAVAEAAAPRDGEDAATLAADVLAAFLECEPAIDSEAKLLRHVQGSPEKDAVAKLLAAVAKLSDPDRARFMDGLGDEPGEAGEGEKAAPAQAAKPGRKVVAVKAPRPEKAAPGPKPTPSTRQAARAAAVLALGQLPLVASGEDAGPF